MPNEQKPIERVWELMKEINIAMLITHDGHGDRLRSRPLAARPHAEENAIYFLSDAQAAKDHEIEANSHVCVAFAETKKQKYVSVTGEAVVSNDRAKIKQLWSAADRGFWNDENDPSIRIIRVTPSNAEYWESSAGPLAAVKMAIHGLTGSKADLGENEKVVLS
jgi:general stress protein 26